MRYRISEGLSIYFVSTIVALFLPHTSILALLYCILIIQYRPQFQCKIRFLEPLPPSYNYLCQKWMTLLRLINFSLFRGSTVRSLLTKIQERKFSTTPINDRQLSPQKIRQKFSVIKTNTSDDIKKGFLLAFQFTFCLEDKKNHKCLLWLLRITGKFFYVIIGDH